MNKERIIEINPGETVVIKHAVSQNEWLTISEFAKLKCIARSTLYCKIKNGEIIVDKSQNKPRINRDQLNK